MLYLKRKLKIKFSSILKILSRTVHFAPAQPIESSAMFLNMIKFV